jgi:hypothetical protein
LSGRFLAITDNLDDLVARLEEIQKRELYVLPADVELGLAGC